MLIVQYNSIQYYSTVGDLMFLCIFGFLVLYIVSKVCKTHFVELTDESDLLFSWNRMHL